MTICWECEAATSQPVAVSIEGLGEGLRPLLLCPSCYRTAYLPLIAEAPDDEAHQAPPEASRRSPSTGRTRR